MTPLDAEMTARSEELDRSWESIAAEVGITTAHLRNFRKGRANVSARKRRRIELSLGWSEGRIARILDGDDGPDHVAHTQEDTDRENWAAARADLREQLRREPNDDEIRGWLLRGAFESMVRRAGEDGQR